ncbi:hypothetical protein PAXRUDRAFT_21920 [Paxillus rubicundulus Ve08.2h10]|uniref:Uncharacterized protein n=1 Tax=Paxillus rubicundulus Ve08.2h10 TaxID=930991 RepID=A0A0D0D6J8_9AGAM|nr:hypothetical protein PAXRUDRAFT_21920 [Paxillus rubicundulus Ve08.2h10]
MSVKSMKDEEQGTEIRSIRDKGKNRLDAEEPDEEGEYEYVEEEDSLEEAVKGESWDWAILWRKSSSYNGVLYGPRDWIPGL